MNFPALEAAHRLLNGHLVDAGVPDLHVALLIELPVLHTIALVKHKGKNMNLWDTPHPAQSQIAYTLARYHKIPSAVQPNRGETRC